MCRFWRSFAVVVLVRGVFGVWRSFVVSCLRRFFTIIVVCLYVLRSWRSFAFVLVVLTIVGHLYIRSLGQRGDSLRGDNKKVIEVGKLIGIDGVVVSRSEGIIRGLMGGQGIIGIIFGVVDRLAGAPLNDQSALLNEGLAFMQCNGFDAGNSRVRDRKLNPFVPGDTGTSGEGHKVVVALCVTGWAEGNGAHGPGAGSVGGFAVFKDLGVGPELNAHIVVVGLADAGDNGCGAHRLGNAIFARKLVEAAYGIRHHMAYHELWEAFKR